MVAPSLFHTRKRRAFIRSWIERIDNHGWELALGAITIAVICLVIYGESVIQTANIAIQTCK